MDLSSMVMRKNASLSALLVLGIFLSGCALQSGPDDVEPGDQQNLQTAVFASVDAATGGEWDKEVLMDETHASERAAKGKWVATDHWDWIAWKTIDASWNVLVSLDGFDCTVLETVPAEFDAFFRDVLYPFGQDRPYCYEWN